MLGHSILWGNMSSNVFNDLSKYQNEYEFVSNIQQTSYRIHLGKEGQDFINLSYENLPKNLHRNQDYFSERRSAFSSSNLPERLKTYKKGSLMRTLSFIGINEYEGNLVDFGSNDSALGNLLLNSKYQSKIEQIISVDVENRNPDLFIDKLHFLLIDNSYRVNLPNESVDFIFFRYSLHHMTFDIQLMVLNESYIILKPHGKLIIVEDTFSLKNEAIFNNNFSQLFSRFSDGSCKMILSMLDASSCFIHEETMPFAFSFRSIEEWDDIMTKIGYSKMNNKYWGVTFSSLFVAPMGIMQYER